MRTDSTPALPRYLQQVKRRLRLGLTTRGVAFGLGGALLLTVPCVLLARRFGFAWWSVVTARSLLFTGVAVVAALFLIRPLAQLRHIAWVRHVERKDRGFAERVRTYLDRARDAEGPMVELLAHDTFERAGSLPPARVVPTRLLAIWAAMAVVALAVLVALSRSPGYMGHGTALLWTGWMKPAPAARQIAVTPGAVTMRRRADLLVRAEPVNFYAETASLSVQHDGGAWESVPMAPRTGARGFEFVLAGVDAALRYRVGMGDATSAEYEVRVEEMPQVRQIKLVYHYPDWTARPALTEEGGDIRAVAGTRVEVHVETDRPLAAGVLRIDDAHNVDLVAGSTKSHGQLDVAQDGLYYVAALYRGEVVRLSDDYRIEATPDRPPAPKLVPGRDVRATSIEEVTLRAQADDDFGVRNLELRYSVNGGREVTVPLSTADKAAVEAAHTMALEPHGLAPGDLVSYYAVARDAKTEKHTDMYFIEVTPFEREFMQSQESGGGAAGGAAGNESSDIARRQRELVVATWNLTREKAAEVKQGDAKTLSALQTRLQRQARTLAERMRRRELADVNKDFQTFVKEMDAAAEEMGPSAERLSAAQWTEALPPEQRALQHLLRAESVFRRIQVSFGRQAGGGGGGNESRDLAEMFDLELDAQKNQYETRQQASSSSASRTEADELQRRLRELAQRQEDAANAGPRDRTTPESRWRQQVLRREIEELMRELQQAQQRAQAAPQQSASPNAQPGGQQTGQSRARPDPSGRRPPSSAASQGEGGEEQAQQQARAGEALDRAARRLEEAAREMRGAEQAQDASERAAAEARARRRLREAEDALAGERQQQRRADGTRRMEPAEAERALQSLQRARDRLEELRARTRRPAPGGSDQPGPEGDERAEAREGPNGGERQGADGAEGQGQREQPGTNGPGGGGSGRAATGRAGGRGGLTGAEAERLTRQALDDLTGAARTIGDDDELGGAAGLVRDEIRRLGSRTDLGRNPELLDRELESLLRATDPIEDRLRQRIDVAGGASVRTLAPSEVPPENRDAVAEYYRRLSETKPTAP